MSTPRWGLFATVALLAVIALVSLSAASVRFVTGEGDSRGGTDRGSADGGDTVAGASPERATVPVPTGRALLVNVAITHGLLGVTVLALAWFSAIPPTALGLGDPTGAAIPSDVARGVALGLGLYLASEAGSAVADRVGVEYDELLRELLAPDGLLEWAVLLVVILPVVAAAEELLFRAALIGALGAGFALPTWLLVVGSSVLFGAGHGAQGAIGIAVTATLGLVLGAAFVLSGSLLVVVVAHYVVNALEFVVREGVLG